MNRKYLISFLLISMTLLPLLNIESIQLYSSIPKTNDNSDLTTSQGGISDNTVMILVNTTLNNSIYNELLTFMQDIKTGLKCNVSLKVFPNSWNHSQVRNFLNNTYQNIGLRGAILVGSVPAFFYEHVYLCPGPKWFRFPWDYYYMDLDGDFQDLDGNNTADTLNTTASNKGPEIWVSRIDASKLVNEVNLYIDYFARNHLIRNVGSRGAQRGLLWMDDDWAVFPYSFQLDACLGELYPIANRTLFNNTIIPPLTDKPNYLANLTLDYEWFWGCVHSWPDAHQIKPSLLTITWSEINNTQKNAEFFNLYNCKAGNFTYLNYLGGWYIFGNTNGQVSISCAREGGFWYGTHDFYLDLSGGDSIGDAWREMHLRGYKTSNYPTGFREPFPTYWQWMGNNWMQQWENYTEGTNLFGDPTLQNCREPTNITILPLGINPTANETIMAEIKEQDDWSLYNVTLQFEAYYGGAWNPLGSNNTDINGMAYISYNLTSLPNTLIPIKVSYAGCPNFYNSTSQVTFDNTVPSDDGIDWNFILLLILLLIIMG